jgi:hypothetical protein
MKKILIIQIFMILNTNANSITSLIDTSGVWVYGGNIIANPTDPNDAIITVASNNVVVDLGEHVLTATNKDVAGLAGIVVLPNLSNVTIRNGMISDLSGVGIYISDGCSEIEISNILVKRCLQGIVFDGLESGTGIINGTVTNCKALSCNGSSTIAAIGLKMNRSDIITIKNCSLNNNDGLLTNSGYGAYINACNNCSVTNCSMMENGGHSLAAGINLINTTACRLINCLVSGTISRDTISTATSFGFLLQGCRSTSITLCTATECSSDNAHSVGFSLSNGSGNAIVNSVSQGNNGKTMAVGFHITNTEQSCAILNRSSCRWSTKLRFSRKYFLC